MRIYTSSAVIAQLLLTHAYIYYYYMHTALGAGLTFVYVYVVLHSGFTRMRVRYHVSALWSTFRRMMRYSIV